MRDWRIRTSYFIYKFQHWVKISIKNQILTKRKLRQWKDPYIIWVLQWSDTEITVNNILKKIYGKEMQIFKTWKQLRCPLDSEWINQLWSLQKTKCYLMPKRYDLATKWWKDMEGT